MNTPKSRRIFDTSFKLQVAQMVKVQGLRISQVCKDMMHGESAVRRRVSQEVGVRLQKKFFAYALLLATGLTPLFPIMPLAQAAQSSAAMRVSVTVVASAKLQTSYQAKQIEISAADVARGQVEVSAASRFSVLTNKGSDYSIQLDPVGNVFESVHVDGLGNAVQLGADGGAIVRRGPQASNLPHALSFRFILHPDTQPGTYPWPLLLSVRAL